MGRSLFALCIAHCSQFEHSGDFTMQSKKCVNVLPVSQVRESPWGHYGDSREGTLLPFGYIYINIVYIYIYKSKLLGIDNV